MITQTITDGLRRRREAADRLPPLASGVRDPDQLTTPIQTNPNLCHACRGGLAADPRRMTPTEIGFDPPPCPVCNNRRTWL